MGIIRTACVFGAIVFFLPLPPVEQAGNSDKSSWQVMSAATSSFTDMRVFCAAQPAICSTADSLAEQIHAKAKYGAALVQDWANEALITETTFHTLREAAIRMMSIGTATATVETTPSIADTIPALRESLMPEQG